MAIMCAASCLITSNPSGSFAVKIFTELSLSIIEYKSLSSPFTLITKACLARDLLIFSATSEPVTLFLKDNFFPSGKVMFSIYYINFLYSEYVEKHIFSTLNLDITFFRPSAPIPLIVNSLKFKTSFNF